MGTDEQVERFDVAITFAGENRAIAERIRQGLVDQGLRVFYDEDFKVEMWGQNLVDFLHKVYSREASYALMLISRSYVEKHWTNHERQAAQERALTESREYILPVRLDDTDVPGMPSTTFYLDARIEGVAGIVNAVAAKVEAASTAPLPAPVTYEGDAPETPEEFTSLLALRPTAWEYLLFAGRLREELSAHKDEYFDFQMGYTPTAGPNLDWLEGAPFIRAATDKLSHAAQQVELVLDPAIQEAAFGAPDEPGDIGRIGHLASRIAGLYGSLMETSSELRAATFPGTHLRKAARIVAQFSVQPVNAIRSFSEDLCAQLTNLPARLEAGEKVTIELSIVFEAEEDLLEGASAEFEAALVEYQDELTIQ